MRRRIALAALALAAVAAAAHADLGPGIRVRPANLSGPLVPGVATGLDFTIDASHATTLTSFRLTGPRTAAGVGTTVSGLPASLSLAANTPATIHVTATVPAEDALLKFQYDADGHTWTEYFDLSRAHYDRMHRPAQAVLLGDLPSIPYAPAGGDDPGAGPPVSPPTHAQPIRDRRADPAAPQSANSHIVRVKGRVIYYRLTSPNGYGTTPLGADHVRVRVFDQETGFDDLLYEGRTDTDGNFDWNVSCDEGQPDIYLEIATINGAVNVQDGTWSSVWSFETSVHVDYPGTFINFGTISPGDSYMGLAIHLHNTATRTWRWWHGHTPVPLAMQAIEWPSGDWAHYDPFGGDLHIPEYIGGQLDFKHARSEAVVSHEFGHAIMNEAIGWTPSFNYDNGICNNDNGDPGHCMWCQEDGGTAVSEGFANWVADMTTRDFQSIYGTAPYAGRDQESVAMCKSNGTPYYYADPFVTEGNFGTLLRDLADYEDETDPGASDHGRDAIHVDVGPLVTVFTTANIASPAQFIQWFRTLYPGLPPNDVWGTMANNRYVLADATPPANVTGFASTDHALNVPSPDATLALAWNATTDGFSGVDYYQAQYATSISGPWTDVLWKDPVTNLSTLRIHATSATTITLAVGSYMVRVRAVDRAGNASAWVSNGPYVIRAPLPADLTTATPSGWSSYVVPRSSTGATGSNCVLSTTLTSNTASTYLNFSTTNTGESATTGPTRTRLRIDGALADSGTTSNFLPAAGGTNTWVNRGPVTVRGGLHTLELEIDALEQLEEPNEANNDRSVQFNWLAPNIAMGARVRRGAPPDPYAGFDGLPLLLPKYANCDGLAYTQFAVFPPLDYPFAGMWAAALDTTEDYNVALFDRSTTTSDGGFRTRLATSSRPAGELDAVLTNTRVRSASAYDVGVLNANLGTHDYLAGAVAAPATALAAGDSAVITMADSAMMALRDLNLTSTSPQAVQVQVLSGTGPIYALWLSSTFATGTLSTFNGKVATNAGGFAELQVTPSAAGLHELVFYRNPRDGWAGVTFKVKIVPLKPDVTPAAPAGWAASLVPRPAADATANSVPAPASLSGDTGPTYLNLAMQNLSLGSAGFTNVFRYLDQGTINNQLFLFTTLQTLVSLNSGPVTLPAGRHTLSLGADPTGLIAELDETNNRTGRQWVWTPPVSPLATPLWRAGTAGGPTAGWDVVDSTQTPAFDADGLRTPVFSTANARGWAAIAVTPRAGSDVDVQLHELAPSATSGFDDPLAFSAWDGEATELVLVNFAATSYRAFDVGVLRASPDTASYSAEIVSAAARGSGVSGPFTLGPDHLVQLHAVDFAAGHHVVDVVNQAGSVDWGAAAYGGPRPYQNRSDGDDLASAWLAPAGESEHLEFDVPAPGRYAIAVFKTGASERAKSGTYSLVVDQAWAGAGPAADAFRRLGASPTPFAARTQLDWTLAQDGDAELAAYDVRGARVRTLARGRWSAGQHSLQWAGDDDTGRALPPGLYFVRLAQAGRDEVTRVVIAR